jgi:hypothetical protein
MKTILKRLPDNPEQQTPNLTNITNYHEKRLTQIEISVPINDSTNK